MSQPFLQLWYFSTCRPYLRDFFGTFLLGGSSLSTWCRRRGKQFSFVITGCRRVLLGSCWSAPFSVKMAGRAGFSITCPKPHQRPVGQMGEKGRPVSLLLPLRSVSQVCQSVEGSQPKLSAWTGNSKDGESRQEISRQNLKQNILPELLAAPTEIRPRLSAVLFEPVYCVCVYKYPSMEWDSAHPQGSTTYMDKGRRKEIFPIFQMRHWILCRYCDCVNEVIARTWSAVGSVSVLFVVNIFRDLQLWAWKYTHSC